jgi:hypothetical protein
MEGDKVKKQQGIISAGLAQDLLVICTIRYKKGIAVVRCVHPKLDRGVICRQMDDLCLNCSRYR